MAEHDRELSMHGPGGSVFKLSLGESGLELTLNGEHVGMMGPKLCQKFAQSMLARWPVEAPMPELGPMQLHSSQSLQRVVTEAYETVKPISRRHGVGYAVVVVDAAERLHYATNMGPTMTSGAFARSASLYDAKPAPVLLDPGTPRGVAVEGVTEGRGFAGSLTTTHPGGGSAGGGSAYRSGGPASTSGEGRVTYATSVISDPPHVGGAGRPGSGA